MAQCSSSDTSLMCKANTPQTSLWRTGVRRQPPEQQATCSEDLPPRLHLPDEETRQPFLPQAFTDSQRWHRLPSKQSMDSGIDELHHQNPDASQQWRLHWPNELRRGVNAPPNVSLVSTSVPNSLEPRETVRKLSVGAVLQSPNLMRPTPRVLCPQPPSTLSPATDCERSDYSVR